MREAFTTHPFMSDPTFNDSEIESFISDCTADNLNDDELLTRLKEDVKSSNVKSCTNKMRRRLRDFLDKNKVECGKGSGQSIETCLLRLLSPPSPQSQADSSLVTDNLQQLQR